MQPNNKAKTGGSGKATKSTGPAARTARKAPTATRKTTAAKPAASKAVKVTKGQFPDHPKSTTSAPDYARPADVDVVLYEQHLTMDADPQLREMGKAQIRTRLTSTTESMSVPVIREHLNVRHEPIHRSQYVKGVRANLAETVHEVSLHGTDLDGTVRRETVPYDRIQLSVTPEVRHVTVEADCVRQECEITEPKLANGDVNVKVTDTTYRARKAPSSGTRGPKGRKA